MENLWADEDQKQRPRSAQANDDLYSTADWCKGKYEAAERRTGRGFDGLGGQMTKRLLTCWFIAMLMSMPVHAGWMKARGGQIPPNAIVAGNSRNGQPLYICRAQYEGSVYPGTLVGSTQDCSISHDGKEHSLSDYEVLAGGSYSWVPVYQGEIPFDALLAGMEQGKPLYVCRGEVNSEWRPGKIRQSYGGCSVPFAGKEQTAPWYEVLVGN